MDKFWLAIGFIGQIVFGSRFFIQWLCSEKEGRSYIPKVFWYLSIIGSVFLLSYAIHKKDPVFIMGQVTGSVIYIRNLFLIESGKNKQDDSKQVKV
ncbi:MAG: lipid-A-disaccharide synthase N-terminal domain-containing protein [Candidatus Caenarcaniphilales bacterium]|nr:lipid-A-disaccharide synthase N-terminal domain-containing protein [Candidatus Caenarcaniphilales bacterium]